jgi:hypothetical protein
MNYPTPSTDNVDRGAGVHAGAAVRPTEDPREVRTELLAEALEFMDEYSDDLATLARL